MFAWLRPFFRFTYACHFIPAVPLLSTSLDVLSTAPHGGRWQVPSRSACVYTSHYCEENVLCLYRDIANAAEAAGATLYVVFVSNQARQVPVWCQVLAESYNKPVLWDYHGESYRSRASVLLLRPLLLMSTKVCVYDTTQRDIISNRSRVWCQICHVKDRIACQVRMFFVEVAVQL